VIRVYDDAGNVIETHEHTGDFKEWRFLLALCRASALKTMPERSTRGHDASFVSNKPVGAGSCCGELKLDCGKNMKWVLFDANELQKFAYQKGGIIMKKTIVTLACLLLAPLAFAQPSATKNRQTTTEPITVTGTIITTTTEEGVAASYQPFKTLVVRVDASNNPGRYVLNGTGHVVNKAGEIVHTAITPGTRVRVYYIDTGHSRLVDHVVVEGPPTMGGTAIIF
jgi:hypothetical protein